MATEFPQPDSKPHVHPRPVHTIDDILDMYKADMPDLPDLPLETGEFDTAPRDEGDMILGFIGIVVILDLAIMVFSGGSFLLSKWRLHSARETQTEVHQERDSLVNKIDQLNEKKRHLHLQAGRIASLQQEAATLDAEIKKVQETPVIQPSPQPTQSQKDDHITRLVQQAQAYLEAKAEGKSSMLSSLMADNLSYNIEGKKGTSLHKYNKELRKDWKKYRTRTYKLLSLGTRDSGVELIYSYTHMAREKSKSRTGFIRERWSINDDGQVTETHISISDNQPYPSRGYTYQSF